MTPDDKKKYVNELKNRAQASVSRADKLLSELAVKLAKLRTGVNTMSSSITEELTRKAD